MEEILVVRELLENALDCKDKQVGEVAVSVALEAIKEALTLPNQNLNHYASDDEFLLVSKMEMLSEAQTFATLLSNTENRESFGTEAKVQTSLTLANITQDVNHVLGAMIYLL